MLRILLPSVVGTKAIDMQVEGNYYYDIKKCGIGFHGDTERKSVVGVRLGATLPICYQWYIGSTPIGDMYNVDLHHGDTYIMSEKTTGYDWKRKKVHTLRHAAGCKKYCSVSVLYMYIYVIYNVGIPSTVI